MSRTSLYARAATAAAWLVTAVGWGLFATQLPHRELAVGGLLWVLAFALAATGGAVLATWSLSVDRPGLSAAGLLLVAVSPTFFAYAINLVPLAMAGAFAFIALSRRGRTAPSAA